MAAFRRLPSAGVTGTLEKDLSGVLLGGLPEGCLLRGHGQQQQPVLVNLRVGRGLRATASTTSLRGAASYRAPGKPFNTPLGDGLLGTRFDEGRSETR